MKTLQNIKVPTGNILITEGEKGLLELVSVGDYGKDKNIVADFLGLGRDISGVTSQEIMSLQEKWVVTISTQYGCAMGCKFCDVPKVGNGENVSFHDLVQQILAGISIHPELKYTKRLNIHFARMGEPTFNWDVIDCAHYIEGYLGEFGEAIRRNNGVIHPVLSTMMPKHNKDLAEYIESWLTNIKNTQYKGDAGLQLSINSTEDDEREIMFNHNSLKLEEIAHIMWDMPRPLGRKITLNFAVADYTIDAQRLAFLFNPKYFIVKLTPMHKTRAASENGIITSGDYTSIYPYKHIEESLKAVGFDVLVFLASEDEDLGRITCGNAILSGTMPLCEHTVCAI